jgi:hypothetical protein
LRSLCSLQFIHIQYRTKSLYCGAHEEETSNHAAKRHCGLMEETKGANEHSMEVDVLCEDCYKELSDDDLGHPQSSDGW